jgi:hypothetical protein
LHHYANKNLEAISAMLAEEVHLRDWNISVFGKAKAIRETVKNFAEANPLRSTFWHSTKAQTSLPENFISGLMERSTFIY